MTTAVTSATGRDGTMRALVRERFGPPEVLRLEQVAKPDVAEDGVLVRVRAASLNRLEWYSLTGTPYIGRTQMGLRKPKQPGLGVDFAGVVEAVGSDVTDFRVGDEVFGGRTGALAEYVSARLAVASKPANVTFEEAAAVPVAGLTALQALRDKGNLQPGQKVLVDGASGGVGTFVVQIAKAFGADVTGVCSTRNVELVGALGADDVVDYTREDVTRSGRRYDLVVAVAGSRSWSDYRRVLEPEGTLVVVGGPIGNPWTGPIARVVKVRLAAMRSSQTAIFFISKLNRPDLGVMAELLEVGKVKPVVERTYDLREAADAFRYVGTGHVQGKVVVTI